MANSNAPFGFRPTMRTLSGAPGSCSPAHKLVGDGVSLFIHDAVTPAAAGVRATPCVKAASGANAVVSGVNLVHGLLNTLTDHIMVRAAGAVFVAQGDGTGGTFLIATQLSFNADAAFTAGDTATKMSKHSIRETSLLGTSTLTLRIRGLFQSPDNTFGQYAKVFVTFNNLADSDQKAGI